jgi:hypothetical protein
MRDHSIHATELLEFFLHEHFNHISQSKIENQDFIDLKPKFNNLYKKLNFIFQR